MKKSAIDFVIKKIESLKTSLKLLMMKPEKGN